MITTALASAYFYYFRRTIRGVFPKHVENAMQSDLADPAYTYGLRRSADFLNFEPAGPSGFWIAEDAGEVIGFVSLSNSTIHISEGFSRSPFIFSLTFQVLRPMRIRRLGRWAAWPCPLLTDVAVWPEC